MLKFFCSCLEIHFWREFLSAWFDFCRLMFMYSVFLSCFRVNRTTELHWSSDRNVVTGCVIDIFQALSSDKLFDYVNVNLLVFPNCHKMCLLDFSKSSMKPFWMKRRRQCFGVANWFVLWIVTQRVRWISPTQTLYPKTKHPLINWRNYLHLIS